MILAKILKNMMSKKSFCKAGIAEGSRLNFDTWPTRGRAVKLQEKSFLIKSIWLASPRLGSRTYSQQAP